MIPEVSVRLTDHPCLISEIAAVILLTLGFGVFFFVKL